MAEVAKSGSKIISAVTAETFKLAVNAFLNAPWVYCTLWFAAEAGMDTFLHLFPSDLQDLYGYDEKSERKGPVVAGTTSISNSKKKRLRFLLHPFRTSYTLVHNAVSATTRISHDLRALLPAGMLMLFLPLSGAFYAGQNRALISNAVNEGCNSSISSRGSTSYLLALVYGSSMLCSGYLSACAAASAAAATDDANAETETETKIQTQLDQNPGNVESEGGKRTDSSLPVICTTAATLIQQTDTQEDQYAYQPYVYSSSALCLWFFGSLGSMKMSTHTPIIEQSYSWYSWSSKVVKSTGGWLLALETPINWLSPVLGLPPVGTPIANVTKSIGGIYSNTDPITTHLAYFPLYSLGVGVMCYFFMSPMYVQQRGVRKRGWPEIEKEKH